VFADILVTANLPGSAQSLDPGHYFHAAAKYAIRRRGEAQKLQVYAWKDGDVAPPGGNESTSGGSNSILSSSAEDGGMSSDRHLALVPRALEPGTFD
jgi:hypothetical protein